MIPVPSAPGKPPAQGFVQFRVPREGHPVAALGIADCRKALAQRPDKPLCTRGLACTEIQVVNPRLASELLPYFGGKFQGIAGKNRNQRVHGPEKLLPQALALENIDSKALLDSNSAGGVGVRLHRIVCCRVNPPQARGSGRVPARWRAALSPHSCGRGRGVPAPA